MGMPDIIATTATAGRSVLDDLWLWFLTNFNTAFIVATVSAVSRMLSRKEHAQTARDLAAAKAELAKMIARKADVASAQSSMENAAIASAIAENTAISSHAADGAERAYHEANSVNAKIEHLNVAQNALQTQQNSMQTDQREHDNAQHE